MTTGIELEPGFRYRFFCNGALTSAPAFPGAAVSATRHTHYHLHLSGMRRVDLRADDNWPASQPP